MVIVVGRYREVGYCDSKGKANQRRGRVPEPCPLEWLRSSRSPMLSTLILSCLTFSRMCFSFSNSSSQRSISASIVFILRIWASASCTVPAARVLELWTDCSVAASSYTDRNMVSGLLGKVQGWSYSSDSFLNSSHDIFHMSV